MFLIFFYQIFIINFKEFYVIEIFRTFNDSKMQHLSKNLFLKAHKITQISSSIFKQVFA